jgi:predicted Zn-dependent peptidase
VAANSNTYFCQYDMVQAELLLMANHLQRNDAQLPVRSIYGSYFGGDMSSVVFQELREQKALAYSANSYIRDGEPDQPSSVYAYIGSQADKSEEALSSMRGILKDMPRIPTAFTKAKESLKKQISTERVLDEAIVYSWLNDQKFKRSKPESQIIWQGLDKVTLDDVVKYQQDYIKSQTFSLSIIADRSKLPKGFLDKNKPLKVLGLKEIFGY